MEYELVKFKRKRLGIFSLYGIRVVGEDRYVDLGSPRSFKWNLGGAGFCSYCQGSFRECKKVVERLTDKGERVRL